MEKKQSELCLEILKRFHKAGILDDFILIGSWCIYFYKEYFSNMSYIDQTTIRTRDIDFLIDKPAKLKYTVNIPELLVEDFNISVPHPANFALHKLIIFQRRLKEDKAAKDRNAAIEVLKALINKGEAITIKRIFNSMLPKWQKRVIKGLDKAKERAILNKLELA